MLDEPEELEDPGELAALEELEELLSEELEVELAAEELLDELEELLPPEEL
ncbi:MAG: hypothetical protein MUF64_20690 [Polyangiaceae bacterium]|nr:hypothetical protein [Polyangiaceae bacterium]